MLDFYLTGGKLNISKSAFAKEMMRRYSILKLFIACSTDGKIGPDIKKCDDATVTIDFKFIDGKKLSDSPSVLCDKLSEKYIGEISGIIYYKGFYPTFSQTFYYEKIIN